MEDFLHGWCVVVQPGEDHSGQTGLHVGYPLNPTSSHDRGVRGSSLCCSLCTGAGIALGGWTIVWSAQALVELALLEFLGAVVVSPKCTGEHDAT